MSLKPGSIWFTRPRSNTQKRNIPEDDAYGGHGPKRLCIPPSMPDRNTEVVENNEFDFPSSVPGAKWNDTSLGVYASLDGTLSLPTEDWISFQPPIITKSDFIPTSGCPENENSMLEAHNVPWWNNPYDVSSIESYLLDTANGECSALTSQGTSLFDSHFVDPVSPMSSLLNINKPSRPNDQPFSQIAYDGIVGPEGSSSPSVALWPNNTELMADQSAGSERSTGAAIQVDTETTASPGTLIDDCDTCFGVIVIRSVSSQALPGNTAVSPVDIKPFGSILKLCFQTSGAYAGLLFQKALRKLLSDFAIFYRGLLISTDRSVKEKQVKKKAAFSGGCDICIVVFGSEKDKSAVGRLLSDAGLFLQHPSPAELPPQVNYGNPHYLLRPGSEMPNLEDLTISTPEVEQPKEADELDMGRLQQVFDTVDIDSCRPTIDLDPSPRLTTSLLSHQRTAVTMMFGREYGGESATSFPTLWIPATEKSSVGKYRNVITGTMQNKPSPARGGVLADEMGLGKTLTVLGLICSSLDALGEEGRHHASEPSKSTTTLIVAPKSTIPGWKSQILKHIHLNGLNFGIYHGSQREDLRSTLSSHDVIITTYETLRSDHDSRGPLFSHKWLRIVLDEAHHIRNRTTKSFRAACGLQSSYRWCLTGTPIHNSLNDYGALLAFIGVDPFREKSLFDFWIVSPFTEKRPNNMENLKTLVRATCIRRTKNSSSISFTLPEVIEKVEYTNLSEEDQELYKFCQDKTAKIAASGRRDKRPKGSNILALMSFLRLICNHGKDLLPISAQKFCDPQGDRLPDMALMLKDQDCCETCGEILERSPDSTSCNSVLPFSRAQCPTCRAPESEDPVTPRDDTGQSKSQSSARERHALTKSKGLVTKPSAKVIALLRNIREEQSTTNQSPVVKSVVFSCWTKMLDLLEPALLAEGLVFSRIDGQTSLKARGEALRSFNESAKCTIMLATIGSCGEGVDLTVATSVHLMEPNWNPMIESQAVDRVHRIGQTRPVRITRYIVPKSIETYIREIQKDKINLINGVIGQSSSKLPADLKRERWKRFQSFLDK